MMECQKCFFNRPMRAWGETFDACFYRLETGKELHGADSECSGFEENEKPRKEGE